MLSGQAVECEGEACRRRECGSKRVQHDDFFGTDEEVRCVQWYMMTAVNPFDEVGCVKAG